jgi:hypothetical protein
VHEAAEIGDARWFEFSPPPRLALASLVARDAGGRVLFSEGFWLPPQGTTRFDSYLVPGRPYPPIPPGARAVYTPPGGAPLSLVDGQETLCLIVEGGEGGCGPVPVSAPQALVASGLDRDGGGTISVVTASDIRALRFQPDYPRDAKPVEVATQPVGDYGGRWRDLRVAGTHLPEESNVTVIGIRDDGAEGKLGEVQLYRSDILDPHPALRLRPRGGAAVTIASERDGDCYDVLFRGHSVYDGCRAIVEVIATCRPRAEVIVTSDPATIRTVERTRLRAHRLNLGQGQHAFAYAVPAKEHVRSARIGGKRIRVGRVPSAREQCGFALSHEGF